MDFFSRVQVKAYRKDILPYMNHSRHIKRTFNSSALIMKTGRAEVIIVEVRDTDVLDGILVVVVS